MPKAPAEVPSHELLLFTCWEADLSLKVVEGKEFVVFFEWAAVLFKDLSVLIA